MFRNDGAGLRGLRCYRLYFVGRWDVGQASFWAIAFEQENYDFAELLVCEGSQAETLTFELIDARAALLDYTFTQGSGDIPTRIDGTMAIGSESDFWSANFFTSDGGQFGNGLFGRCIERIEVITE